MTTVNKIGDQIGYRIVLYYEDDIAKISEQCQEEVLSMTV